jgi:imidazolonepropionase-like amidohydrolase
VRENPPEYVPSIEALLPVLRGDRFLIVHANHAQTITDALSWAEERGLLDRLILTGVLEGWRVADRIAEKEVPVLVGPVLDLPGRPSDRYDKAYANAGLMKAAGVKLAIRTGETENVRNLPYHAGFAAAYGLGRDEALRAVTIDAAEIFGVADLIGSIEVGKLANLFVADGDPFETRTQVRHLFINGFKIPLDNRQRRLYDEFLERDPGLELLPGR